MSNLEFQEVYETFRPGIYRYLTRLVGEDDAEDLTQEVFIKVNRGLKDLRNDSQLSNWIYRIASNTALDRFRSPSYKQQIKNVRNFNAGEDGIDYADRNPWTGKDAPTAEEKFIQKEMYECRKYIVHGLEHIDDLQLFVPHFMYQCFFAVLSQTGTHVAYHLHNITERHSRHFFSESEDNHITLDTRRDFRIICFITLVHQIKNDP